MYYLELLLEGVLQSYGNEENAWRTRRDTQLAPTKSAVVGIIGCSLGFRKEADEYQELNNLIYLYKQNAPSKILNDYQLIRPKERSISFEDSRFWSVSGSHNGVQFPTIKEYLMDTSFVVYVGSDDPQTLRKIHQALRDPVWAYYLGRACCTPSQPIVKKEFVLIENLEEPICTCLS